MTARRHVLIILLAALSLAVLRGEVRIKPGKECVEIEVHQTPFATLQFGRQAGKPFLHPLRTASGKVVTRGFTENTAPGQAGVWIGLRSLNGVDYWETDDPSRPGRKAGAVVLNEIRSILQGLEQSSFSFTADWVDPNGDAVIAETRTLTFSTGPEDSRAIDIDLRLEPRRRVEIADRAAGLMGLRLSEPFEEHNGGRPRIFSWDAGADAVTGKRSPWLEYMTILQGERVGVLVMDHPRNHNFPTRWKVRPFASIFATPFAELDYYNEAPLQGPAPRTARDAGVTLEKGEPMRFRYRIVVHPSTFDIHEAWRDFCQQRWDRR